MAETTCIPEQNNTASFQILHLEPGYAWILHSKLELGAWIQSQNSKPGLNSEPTDSA